MKGTSHKIHHISQVSQSFNQCYLKEEKTKLHTDKQINISASTNQINTHRKVNEPLYLILVN